MPYSDFIAQSMRSCILRLLSEDATYTHNESLLLDLLTTWGFEPGRERLHAQLQWLERQGLVTLSGEDHCPVAKLTKLGLDVAEGREIVDGVKRPEPR